MNSSQAEETTGAGPVLLKQIHGALYSHPDPLLIVDVDGLPTFVNAQARRLLQLGWSGALLAEQIDALRFRREDGQPVPPDQLPLALALRGEATAGVPLVLVAPDGKSIALECSASPIRDAQGAGIGAFVVFRRSQPTAPADGKEQKLVASVDAQRRLTQSIMALAPVGIILVDGITLKIKWANEAFRQVQDGLSRTQSAIGQPLSAVLTGVDQSGLTENLRAVVTSLSPYVTQEFEYRSESRGLAYWRLSALPIATNQPGTSDVLVMILDVTDQVQAKQVGYGPVKSVVETEPDTGATEAEAAATSVAEVDTEPASAGDENWQALEAVLDNLPEGILVVGEGGAIVLMNKTALRYFGFQSEAEVPDDCQQLAAYCSVLALDGQPMAPNALPWERVLRGEGFDGLDGQLGPTDGEKAAYVFDGVTLADGVGLLRGLVTIREQREQGRVKWLRSECMDVISEQIKTPLASLATTADWLCHRLQSLDLAKEGDAAATIFRRAELMHTMTKDLVEASWLESGHKERRRTSVALLRLAVESVQRADSTQPSPRVRLECPEWVPPVSANRERLERTIAALLDRALKVTPANESVVLRLGLAGDEALVSVVDRGKPIPAGEEQNLFSRFHRRKEGAEAVAEELSLYIARLTVESHDGRIWAETQSDGSNVITFTLPVYR